MRTKITGGRIICDNHIETAKALYIEDDKIVAITAEDVPADHVIDAKGDYVSPGFIDIHTHGAGGHDFMDDGMEPVVGALKMHLKHGTTSVMPTLLTANPVSFRACLSTIDTVMKDNREDLPHVLGAHLEGPYFSMEQRGAQAPEFITPPIKEELI